MIDSKRMDKVVYVVYGSQTGNGMSLAEEFSNDLRDVGHSVVCCSLNTMKENTLINNILCLIIVCSTCGTGDCPENADEWWRYIVRRSLAKDTYSNVQYAVLALGDVKYKKLDSFCKMGLKIDKRLEQLGGRRILGVHCADESTDFEETVEAWKVLVVAQLEELARQCTGQPINIL